MSDLSVLYELSFLSIPCVLVAISVLLIMVTMTIMTTMTVLGDLGPGDLGPGPELWSPNCQGTDRRFAKIGWLMWIRTIQASNLMMNILRKHIDKDDTFSQFEVIWKDTAEKRSLKFNYCNFTWIESNQLKMNLKTCRGKKSGKIHQSDFSSAQANILETNSKTHYKKIEWIQRN